MSKWILFVWGMVSCLFWMIDGDKVYRPIMMAICLSASLVCFEIEKLRESRKPS